LLHVPQVELADPMELHAISRGMRSRIQSLALLQTLASLPSAVFSASPTPIDAGPNYAYRVLSAGFT